MKNFFQKIGSYIKDAYSELVYKVSWPTRAELTSSAVVVLSASLILAVIVFAVDSGFEFIMNRIYGIIF